MTERPTNWPWFRLYAELLDDFKVRNLTDREFRHWILLMCAACNGKPRGTIGTIPEVAFRLRISEEDAEASVKALFGYGFLERAEGGYKVHNWEKWQMPSDSSTPRVRKHRERAKQKEWAGRESSGSADRGSYRGRPKVVV